VVKMVTYCAILAFNLHIAVLGPHHTEISRLANPETIEIMLVGLSFS
jgi:hypothetical protein